MVGTALIMDTTGIELKCGMIGHGVSLHIDGHHSDMIDGDIITGWAMLTGVGIATMAGITMAGMDITMTGTGDGE
jgi:TPP-dependent pyruvate/acetoin dehydrogenase alpha subunit